MSPVQRWTWKIARRSQTRCGCCSHRCHMLIARRGYGSWPSAVKPSGRNATSKARRREEDLGKKQPRKHESTKRNTPEPADTTRSPRVLGSAREIRQKDYVRQESATIFADHPSAAAYRDAARLYCALIDGYRQQSRGSFIKHLEPSLTFLYYAGSQLPDVTPATANAQVRVQSAADGDLFGHQFAPLRAFLGDYDTYREVFDPLDPADEPIQVNLAGDLIEIYEDCFDNLKLLEILTWRRTTFCGNGDSVSVTTGAGTSSVHYVWSTPWCIPTTPTWMTTGSSASFIKHLELSRCGKTPLGDQFAPLLAFLGND